MDLFDDLEDNPHANYEKANNDLFYYIHHFYEDPDIKHKLFFITYMIKNILDYETYLYIIQNIHPDEYFRSMDEYNMVMRLSRPSQPKTILQKIPYDVISAELQPFIRKSELLDDKISDKFNERKETIQHISGNRFFYKYYLFLLKLKTDFDNEKIPFNRYASDTLLSGEQEFDLLNMYIFILSIIYKKMYPELPLPSLFEIDIIPEYNHIFNMSAGKKKYKTKKRNQKNKKTNKRKNKK